MTTVIIFTFNKLSLKMFVLNFKSNTIMYKQKHTLTLYTIYLKIVFSLLKVKYGHMRSKALSVVDHHSHYNQYLYGKLYNLS